MAAVLVLILLNVWSSSQSQNKGNKVLVTTLTKRMAEELTDYMREVGIRVKYLHSDIDTLERIEIVRDLRMGVFDVLVGINLLKKAWIFQRLHWLQF